MSVIANAVKKKSTSSTKTRKPRINTDDLPPLYKCTKCGKITQDPVGNFYMVKVGGAYEGNGNYSHLCTTCVNKYFEEQRAKLKDEKLAVIMTCSLIGACFAEELYETMRGKGEFKFGEYLRSLNGPQYRTRSFYSFLVGLVKDGEKLKSPLELMEQRETRWRGADLKNRNYVISTVGYDCFEDESYTEANRKFLFNTLADYLTDDVIEDPHKLQCVIMMVKTTLQVDSIDKMINKESLGLTPNYDLIKKLSGIKKDLASGINSIANENGISAKTSGKSGKHANALTYIMKEMAENNFDEIKTNIVEIKMSESYKEVAAQNAKALFAELNYTSDEYARLLAEQSVKYGDAQEKITDLEEQLRLLRIELAALKDVGKK